MHPLRSLRVRLVLWTVAMEALLLLVIALVLMVILRNAQYQQIDETLRLSAAQLNAVVDVSQGSFNAAAAETADLRARGILAWVLAPSGEIALTVGDAGQQPVPAALPPSEQIGGARLDSGAAVRVLVTPLQESGETLGRIVAAMPLDETQEFLYQVLLGLVVAIPIVLALSVVGGLFLANRALAPVATITATAREISAADLSLRLNMALPDDEIGQLAQTFDAMLERLDAAFQRERQLTSDVSHELRTPLGLLKTQLSLARSRPRDNAALLAMMADMEDDVDRMTGLIEQLLILARMEQKGLVTLALVDLHLLLADLVEQFQQPAREQQVALDLSLPAQINLQLMGDAESLRQVFRNLIENALKHTPAGGRVSVAANHIWQEIAVSVSDTGVGIPPEHQPYLFERFYRVDSARARDTGGYGLGLAICRSIVQAHGGQIAVDSQPGAGSTFTVTLPVGHHEQAL